MNEIKNNSQLNQIITTFEITRPENREFISDALLNWWKALPHPPKEPFIERSLITECLRSEWREDIEDPAFNGIAAVDSRMSLLGFAVYKLDPESKTVAIQGLSSNPQNSPFLHPEQSNRVRGVGSAILNRLGNQYKDWNLSVWAVPSATPFYASAGFTETEKGFTQTKMEVRGETLLSKKPHPLTQFAHLDKEPPLKGQL